MVNKIFLSLFLIPNLFLVIPVFGQAVGDYRSTNVVPAVSPYYWNVNTSWQRWDGFNWTQPTAGQGYPGQFSGTGTVTVRDSNTIIINTSVPNDFAALVIGEGVSGSLIVGDDVSVLTLSTTINANGIMKFSGQNEIHFPVSASIEIKSPGKIDDGGTCTNNVAVYIGTVKYAVCVGNGNADFTFTQLNSGGGTLKSNPSCTPPPCGNTINLIGAYTGVINTSKAVTYSWTASGPSAVVFDSNTNTSPLATINPSTYPSVYTFNLTISNDGNSNSKTISVTVNALPTTPIVTTTNPTCTVSTGTITVTTPSPASGITYTVTGTNPVVASATNITGVFSGLAVGTYSVTAKNFSGCVSNAVTATIISPVTKTWNGSLSTDWNAAANWTPSGVPTSSNCVIISLATKSPIISGTNYNAYTNTLTVLSSGKLTVDPTNTITVTDFVNVNSAGSLTFENTASLVQINDVVNTGSITYKRGMTTNRETDYTYWSSPVANQKLSNVSPGTPSGYFYSFSAAASNWYQESSASNMLIGIGYIIRGQHYTGTTPPGFYTALFVGTPNNGTISLSGIVAKSYYLLGNPYPSALDADSFLFDNNTVLDGTLYFWTHNTPIGTNVSNPGSGVYAYSGDDYASYNITGGVGTGMGTGNLVGSVPQNSNKPSGKIASGQGFFTSSKTSPTATTIEFNNTMRVGAGGIIGDNSQFFKIKKPKFKTVIPVEKNRIWVNLSNNQGAFKQTLVGYITGATDDYDAVFDGESFDGNQFVDFYSVNQGKNLVIQGRALPFDENDSVPLGFRTSINGTFAINIDQVDGLLTNQAVFIEDKLTNAVFDLKNGNYTFTTVAGTFNDRFALSYTNKTLGTNNFETATNKVLVSNTNKQIKINSFVETIDNVSIYDLLGRQIYRKNNVNSKELLVYNLGSSRQALVVKTSLQSGKTFTDKIIY